VIDEIRPRRDSSIATPIRCSCARARSASNSNSCTIARNDIATTHTIQRGGP